MVILYKRRMREYVRFCVGLCGVCFVWGVFCVTNSNFRRNTGVVKKIDQSFKNWKFIFNWVFLLFSMV